MNDTRAMAVEWIRMNGLKDYWSLRLFHYLIDKGVSADDALDVMTGLVNDVLHGRVRRAERIG